MSDLTDSDIREALSGAEYAGIAERRPEEGEQQSIQWLMARVGKVTASNFHLVMDFTAKRVSSAKRDTYLWNVIVERLTGKPTEHYVNAAMEHGTEFEPLARMRYEAATGRMVEEVGFITHPELPDVGGSPDGLVGDDGMVEIKCPTSRTHLQMLLTHDNGEYLDQMQGLLWINGRQWCDFVCFDPRMPAGLDLFILREERDDDYIADLAAGVEKFRAEVAARVSVLRAMIDARQPA